MKRWLAPLLVASLALLGGDCDDDDDDDFIIIFPVAGPAADLNLDGFADLVIGAPRDDGGGAPGARRGAVFVHLGGPGGPSPTPDLTLLGSEDGAEFGTSVALVGDVNALGAPDLLVGAPLDDGDGNGTDEGIDRGAAFVFFGGTAMDAIPDVGMTGAEPGAEFGRTVARIADTNLDGFDDWIVGAPFDDGDGNTTDEGTDRGRALLFVGSFTPDGIPDFAFTGQEAGSRFGFAVASAGDINFGGADDIAVGAPLDDGDDNATDEGADRGRVYVFGGGVFLDAVPDLVITGDEDGAELGSAVQPALDVSGDGIDDLLVGAPRHDAGAGAGADRGEAYVYVGSSAPDAVADILISGGTDGGAFGASVSRTRDANGDGFGDFVVGAPLEDPGAIADAGSAYLFLGGPGILDGNPDLFFDGTEAGAQFGAAVAGPGDFDGGGRDIAIGAPFDDADGNATDEGTDRGSAFVFSGGAGLDAVPDAIVDGAQDGALAATGIAN